jgi:tetratricopeptide (TPR) repeat protein
MARQNLWASLGLDLTLSFGDLNGDGNDTNGYHETFQLPRGKKIATYVVKEGGQYKILAAASDPAAIGLEALDRIAGNDLDGTRALLDWLRGEMHLKATDDPFFDPPFHRLWEKGQDATAEQMRVAAASIMVDNRATARQGLAILEDARRNAVTEADKTNIDAALMAGYYLLDDYEKVEPVAARLAMQHPESASALSIAAKALRALGRFYEAQAIAEQRLKRLPGDRSATDVLFQNAIAQGDYQKAYDLAHQAVEAGSSDASDLNNLAWMSLYFDRPGGPDIESALKATGQIADNWGLLHTLGCLYAEVGKTKEAHDVLIQAMDLSDLVEPNSDFWYGFGRIAEQYGEREIALADYAKVTKPKDALDIPQSTYRLAQTRIKALQNQSSSTSPSP